MGLFQKFKDIMLMDINPYNKGLAKTNIDSKISLLSKKHKQIDDKYYEDLEEILITSDVGLNTVLKLIDKIKKRVKEENITDLDDLKEIIVDELFIIYVGNELLTSKIDISKKPTVILVIGVNGVGKTTSIGKLANYYKKLNKKVLLIGADTFRAGAREQLLEWSKKVMVDYYSDDKEPSAVVYAGLEKALLESYDIVLIDTAGRLQNKDSLMRELEKINKVILKKVDNKIETLLVIDASTGQNGISQAKNFKSITDITGIILTKLDGTSKGGIVLAIKEETNIPVKFIGVGEKLEDIEPFDIEKYIYSLFSNKNE